MTLRFLILVSLCTLIYSDSLSHFQEIDIVNIGDVALRQEVDFDSVVHKIKSPGPSKIPTESVYDGPFESCANQCLLTKFFCRSFMVVALKDEMQCIMDYNRWANLMDYFTDARPKDPRFAKFVVAYEYFSHFNGQGSYSSNKEDMDNVEQISKYSTLLQDHKFDEILRGYGVFKGVKGGGWDDMVAFLELCAAALNVPKSRPKNFRKWLNGEESFYEHSMSVSTSKSTDNYEHVSKRQKVGDRPDFNLLMFLDLFSRTVDRNTETIYDPEEGTLYIHSRDIQVLFISHDKDDYIWAAMGNKVRYDVYLGVSNQDTPKDKLSSIFDDFLNAARCFDPGFVPSDEFSDFDFNLEDYEYEPKLWRLVTFLTGHQDWDAVPYNESLLCQDFSKVVPIIHEKRMMPYTEKLQKSFPKELVGIITQ